MSDTCPTCQHERFRHDGNTPGCIECDCNDLWGDGEYFVYSDLSLLAELADEVNRLRALTTADDAMVSGQRGRSSCMRQATGRSIGRMTTASLPALPSKPLWGWSRELEAILPTLKADMVVEVDYKGHTVTPSPPRP